MQKQAECWQPLCAVTQRLVSKLEQQHRDKFKRDCREDGVPFGRGPILDALPELRADNADRIAELEAKGA